MSEGWGQVTIVKLGQLTFGRHSLGFSDVDCQSP
jgi:hypothetical protein